MAYDPLYSKCKHCHLFVGQNPAFEVGANISRWMHYHRGDEADEALDESHDPKPGDSAELSWWKMHGPAEMRARFDANT